MSSTHGNWACDGSLSAAGSLSAEVAMTGGVERREGAWARDALHKQYSDDTGQTGVVPSVTTLLGARTMVSRCLPKYAGGSSAGANSPRAPKDFDVAVRRVFQPHLPDRP